MTLTQITEKGIKDGEIVNADINASAAIATSKITGLATSATTDTTNASNIGSGSLANARLTKPITFADTEKAIFGTGSDLEIYHDGNNSYITDSGTGRLKLVSSTVQVRNAANTETIAQFIENGAVELYYDNSKKIETTSAGVTVSGEVSVNGNLLMNHADNHKIFLGAGDDLQIYHDGTHSRVVDTGTGNLILQGSIVNFQNVAGTENMIKATENGAVELYYDNNKVCETAAHGLKVSRTTSNNCYIEMITSGGIAGYLYGVSNSEMALLDREGHYFIKGTKDGSVELYHDNSKKFETTSAGATVTGTQTITGGGSDNLKIDMTGAVNPYINFREGSTNKCFLQWDSTYDDLRIYNYDSVADLRIGDGGIKFHGDTAVANTLDDYEQGTFTPTFSAGYSYASTITYSSQMGHYTKIGNQVFAYIYLRASGNSAHSGNIITDGNNLTVSGLPFTCTNVGQNEGGGYITYTNGFLGTNVSSGNMHPMPWVPLSNNIVIFHTPEDGNNLHGNETTPTDTYFIFQVRYHV